MLSTSEAAPVYFWPNPSRLPGRKIVTFIGAFKCWDGAVLFADGQETIQDHGKWDVQKIYLHESPGLFRVFMTASGDSTGIEMLWKEVERTMHHDILTSPMGTPHIRSTQDLQDFIVRTVSQVTKKCIFPNPGRDKPYVDAIWIIQQLAEKDFDPVIVFRTDRLFSVPVETLYFTGSNLVLPRYIADLFGIGRLLWGFDEGEALAAFLLMEVKAYDPNVGKQSDIIILGHNGSLRWVSVEDVRFWEDHFAEYKATSKELLKMTSTDFLAKGMSFADYIKRVAAKLRQLKKTQSDMRAPRGKRIAKEEEMLKLHACKH